MSVWYAKCHVHAAEVQADVNLTRSIYAVFAAGRLAESSEQLLGQADTMQARQTHLSIGTMSCTDSQADIPAAFPSMWLGDGRQKEVLQCFFRVSAID